MFSAPLNLNSWIEENKDLLKPPVGNKVIWKDSESTVMIVGGPNARTDFHINPTEEFFYQIKGDITLKIIKNEKIEDVVIKEGEVFLLPSNAPHSPRRPKETIGLVIEQPRGGKQESLAWYCEHCSHKLFEEWFVLADIENQFQGIFQKYKDLNLTQCPHCGETLS